MLYIVATPIGNLAELTRRAEEALRGASVVYCEDTRHSRILMQHYGITTPLISYQKFNERARVGEIVGRLQVGEDVALISDAGMPLISDPGGILLETLIEQDLPYTVVSGPCAAVNAAVLSGLVTGAFCFVGFLPEKNLARKQLLRLYADTPCPLIFYTARHNVDKDVAEIAQALPSRPAALVREISKTFEQVVRFTLGEPFEITKKGEFVLVVGGAGLQETPKELLALPPEQHLAFHLDSGIDKPAAIKRTARERGVPKSEIYKLVHARPEQPETTRKS